jgi:hypothetical protein
MNFRFSLLNVAFTVRSFHSNQKVFSDRGKDRLLNLLITMPKDTSHVARLQSERQAKKISKMKYPPGTVTLQVLGSGVRGAPRSLYMFTDQSW